MMWIQILLTIFFIFAIFKTLFRYKSGFLVFNEALFWCLLWFVAGIVVLTPEFTVRLANILGVGRGVDLIIYISVALLFYLIFKINIKIEKINKDITKITRKKSLEVINKK